MYLKVQSKHLPFPHMPTKTLTSKQMEWLITLYLVLRFHRRYANIINSQLWDIFTLHGLAINSILSIEWKQNQNLKNRSSFFGVVFKIMKLLQVTIIVF